MLLLIITVAVLSGYIAGWKARKPPHPATLPNRELLYEAAKAEVQLLLDAKAREAAKYQDESDEKSEAMKKTGAILEDLERALVPGLETETVRATIKAARAALNV